MEMIAILISIIGLIIMYFQLLVPIQKGEVVIKLKPPFLFRNETKNEIQKDHFYGKLKQSFTNLSIEEKILSYIWYYPLGGTDHESWAVKESYVLRGELLKAKENPGLGVAVYSIELGINVFGNYAMSRIDACIDWALLRTQKKPPYFIQVEIIDPITSKKELKSDFRHTLAFSIILSKTNKKQVYLAEYLKFTLNLQKADGSWPPGEGITISEVFTVSYAIELLKLNLDNEFFEQKVRNEIRTSLSKAINWLIANKNKNMLWESGVLKEFKWDDLVTTAWMLRRLLPLKLEDFNDDWVPQINVMINSLVRKSTDEAIWSMHDDIQRFRVEARIASAIYEGIIGSYIDPTLYEFSTSYLNDWKRKTTHIMQTINFSDFDLGTALFIYKPLIGYDKIKKIRDKVISSKVLNN